MDETKNAQITVYMLIIQMAENDEIREQVLPRLPRAFQIAFNSEEPVDYPIIFRLVSDSSLTETNFDNVLQIFQEIELEISNDKINAMIKKMKRHFQLSFEQKLNFDRMKKSFEYDMKNAEATLALLGKTLTDTKIEMVKLKKQEKEATEKIEQLQMSTNSIYAQFVTILGIFSAIVLSVFGGLQLITSSFENLYRLPAWKAVLMSSIIAIAVLSMLFLLTRWVSMVINQAFNYDSERGLLQLLVNNGAFSTGIFLFGYLIIASVIFSSNDVTERLKALINVWEALPILLLLTLPLLGGIAVFIKTFDLRKYK